MHSPNPDWLPILRRTVGAAAIVMALGVVAVWAGNFAITKEAVEALGPDIIVNLLTMLGWIEIVAGAVVVLGLAVGQWFHRPLWAPGVLFVVLGMALHWGWWLLDRRVDLFGTSGFTDPDPELVRRAALRVWVMLAIDSFSIALLLVGAVLLLRRAGRSGQAYAASDGSSEGSDDDNDDVGGLELQGDSSGGEGQQAGVQGDAATPATHGVQHRQGRE
ncbi:MAG TPA: hypothetical protein VGK17_10440 [Propionicimonas sp.]